MQVFSDTRVRIFSALVLLALSAALPAQAQTSLVNATVVGTVSDAQKAVIPGATVTVTNPGDQHLPDGRHGRRGTVSHRRSAARRLPHQRRVDRIQDVCHSLSQA